MDAGLAFDPAFFKFKRVITGSNARFERALEQARARQRRGSSSGKEGGSSGSREGGKEEAEGGQQAGEAASGAGEGVKEGAPAA